MFTAKIVRAALVLTLLAAPAFSFAAEEPPPAAPEGPKPLGPGLLGLEFIIGPVDNAVDNAKEAISKAIGIDVSGFLDAGYQYSSNHPHSSSSISGRYFDKDHNKVVFNAFNLTVDKPEKDWGVGFHISADFGRAGELLREATLWGPRLTHEPWAELREAFLTFTIPVGAGLAVKAGKFVTPLGTEILPAPGSYNNNISRSFAFNFAVPLTHLGTLFTYPFAKTFSASAGLVTGWDNPADNNNSPSFLGGVNFTPSDTFNFVSNATIGREWTAPGFNKRVHNGGTRIDLSNVATIKADPWTIFLEYTIGHEKDALTPQGTRSAWWHAFAGILSYDWTDRFNTSLRGESFLDPQAARTGGLNATHTLHHVNLAELTLTGAYKFTAKLLGRVEVRQDVADKKVFKEGGSGADKAQTTFALQGIYTF
jgi:Putative beta-barrel porin-2, OmpL-like. bbp2